jgi:hypothetical protein
MLVFTLYVLAQIYLGPREVSPQSYIFTALLASSNPPMVLQKIVIGNGLFYDVSQSTNIAIARIRVSPVSAFIDSPETDEHHRLISTIDKLRRGCIRRFQIQVCIAARQVTHLTY